MDVLLIYPKAGHDVRGVSVNAPLALLSIASTLIPDFSVTILDQRTTENFWKVLDQLLKQRPLVVGLTSMTGTQIYYALEITKYIKERGSTPIIWGGMHPTLCSEEVVAKPYIDGAIIGEGEQSFRQLVEILSQGSNNLAEVAGLARRVGGTFTKTPQAPPLSLDLLPAIPWHLVDAEEYVTPAQFLYPGIKRLLPIQGSRGCPFKCTFCSEPALTRTYRMMSPKKLVDECLAMSARFNLDHIVFFDEEFFVDTRWANEIAEAIDGKFSWNVQTRAADLLRVDLKRLERCGLRVVMPGLESGSNRILRSIRKGERVDEYRETNRRLAETSIHAQFNFIVGFPTETESELEQTMDLALELLRTNPQANVNQLSPLTPLPGTQLLNEVVAVHNFQRPRRLEDWIGMTRGRQERSWLNPRMLRRIRFLYYTSLFLCSAERYSQKLKIPAFLLRLYSRTIRWRWRKRLYWINADVKVLRLLFRLFINPIDYSLSKNYGDSH